MNNIDSYFLSINDDIFCPPVLAKIKEYLNCEQAFIYKLDQQGELKSVIHSSDTKLKDVSLGETNLSQIDHDVISKLINTDKATEDELGETAPVKKAELYFPIELKTPEVILANNNISLWGILLIYDYNYLRQWSDQEKEFVQQLVNELTLGVERKVIYGQFKILEETLKYYQFFDEKTGLINYSSFIDCLDYEWRNLSREKKPLSLILINFYQPNNSRELISDNIIKIIQGEIKRPADMVAGYDENRIIVMLPSTDNAGVLWVNQQLIKKLKSSSHNETNYQYRSSIVTCIPPLNQTYQFILDKVEMPFHKNLNFADNIYNQNLE